MNFSKVRNVKTPNRAHRLDAGIDFFVPEDYAARVNPGESVNIPSGIKVEVPSGFALVAFNKSGIASKKQLLAGACVVDAGYTGEVHLNLLNVGNQSVDIEPGQKILQFMLLPVLPCTLVEVDEISGGERGEGGFGSTG